MLIFFQILVFFVKLVEWHKITVYTVTLLNLLKTMESQNISQPLGMENVYKNKEII